MTRPRSPPLSREEPGLRLFNGAPAESVHPALLACCGSERWARRIAAHRPYPDLASLLAAADEASYDLSHADLSEALAAESPAQDGGRVRAAIPATAVTALRAAVAAYESSFGHAFVLSLDGVPSDERLDRVLSGIRTRLGHDRDEERSVAAEELRRLARTRVTALVDRAAAEAAVPAPAPAAAVAPAGHGRRGTASPSGACACLIDHTGDPRASGPTTRR